jgi:hypothetical protein
LVDRLCDLETQIIPVRLTAAFRHVGETVMPEGSARRSPTLRVMP